jgi:hypothetical protein
LSKIADLKVISRTSTQRFKSAPNNLLEIAKQLGVDSSRCIQKNVLCLVRYFARGRNVSNGLKNVLRKTLDYLNTCDLILVWNQIDPKSQ